MSTRFLAIFALILACASVPARAQDVAAPFDGDLQRLAEILGGLHYLRGICGANEGNKWRSEMQALIDAETPSGERRTRMIAGFNRGYNGFQQTYRSCTPAATVAIRRYIEEGSKISRDLDRALRELSSLVIPGRAIARARNPSGHSSVARWIPDAQSRITMRWRVPE